MKKFLSIPRSFYQLPKLLAKACSVVGLSILLLIPFWVNAQVYHPLVDSGTVWNQETLYCDIYFGHLYLDGERYGLLSDTIIQGLTYSLLQYKPTYFCSFLDCSSPELWSIVNDSITPPSTIGALREDSNKKVWFYSFDDDSIFLLYDFKVEVGDSLAWYCFPTLVESIDSIQLLNGEWRKRFNLNSNWPDESWIEGIGSSRGILDPINCDFQTSFNLNCYHKNGELLYDGTFENLVNYITCDVVDGINHSDNMSSTCAISPNPAADFFTINFSSSNFSSAQIKITNVLGRNLFSEEIKSNQPLQIATEKFSGNSMLFCELWQEGKLIGVKKVLIQR